MRGRARVGGEARDTARVRARARVRGRVTTRPTVSRIIAGITKSHAKIAAAYAP